MQKPERWVIIKLERRLGRKNTAKGNDFNLLIILTICSQTSESWHRFLHHKLPRASDEVLHMCRFLLNIYPCCE